MHIRPMLRSDIPEVVTLEMTAFKDDKFHQWLNPAALQPGMAEARRRLYYNKVLDNFVSSTAIMLVCVETSTKQGENETILGSARWHRVAPAESPTQKAYSTKSRDFTDWFQWAIATPVRRFYEDWMAPNPAKDSARWRHFIKDVTAQNWSGCLKVHWYLGYVGVHPKYGGRGVGRMLVKWGMDKAQQEGIPVTLESSFAGEQFYPKLGFKVVDWASFGVISEMEGGSCLVYDPQMKYIRDLEPGENDWVEYGGFRRKIDVKWRTES